MSQTANVFGRNAPRFRYKKGWSQNALAAKMQLLGIYITRNILANIETLRSPATDKRVVIFAEIFSVPVDDFSHLNGNIAEVSSD